MSKAKELHKALEDSFEHSSDTLSWLETMNHKTLEDVEELIKTKLDLMNEQWEPNCGVEWNVKFKTLEHFLNELKSLKL